MREDKREIAVRRCAMRAILECYQNKGAAAGRQSNWCTHLIGLLILSNQNRLQTLSACRLPITD